MCRVSVHYLEDETTPTGTCAVLITDKDRSLVANLAAANCYKKDHFDSSAIQEVVKKVKVIYITVRPFTDHCCPYVALTSSNVRVSLLPCRSTQSLLLLNSLSRKTRCP